ncbi:uncharacterized protein LOC134225030 isoform X2 [Armigeres subalbatus]|uniref:uncharacterized protein LOC134225030 isoform X2 n=1 Tax=Armigeres subalbatus TaxID=124917 RepID=UPI002ED4CCC8
MSEASSDSESCPSFATESESEHDSTWGDEKDQKEVDFTATAKEIICENVNITTENALKLNSGYHNMLKMLKNKLEILLSQCQERQAEIDKQIEDYKSNRKPLVRRSRMSGYICGQPFFKDGELYPGPHNDDYLHRKNAFKEFFPLDMFETTDSNWTVKDKVNILKGVKGQIVEFIERETRLKIKKLGNGLEAERLRLEMGSLKRREMQDLWDRVKKFSNEYPGQKFEIDWMRISNVDISGRHSVSACVGLWNNYMLPGLVRDAWKTEEESLLVKAAERNKRQGWAQIASEVPGRSAYQCFVHYQTTFSDLAQIKRERWTDEEDALLMKAVEDNRIGSNIIWNKVVEKMPLRNKIQCYNRYMFTLMRPTKNAKFTPEEDCVILAYVQQCGDDFRFIPSNLLPGRTNRQVWARYNHTLKFTDKQSGWTIEEDTRLLNYIKDNITEAGPKKISWADCSRSLGNHSRLSCRTRFYTIEKFLEKNPDATLDEVPRKEKKLSSTVTHENWMKTFVNIRNAASEPKPETTPPVQEGPSTSGKGKAKRKKNSQKKQRRPRIETRPFVDTIKSVFHLLNCTTNLDSVSDYMEHFVPNERVLLRSSLSIRFNPKLMTFLEDAKSCFLFPPNYNTMIGVRGVILNATHPDDPKTRNTEETIRLDEEDEAGYHYALETFRDRFRMMFYWTMLLVRQNPDKATIVDGAEQPKPVYHLEESDANQQKLTNYSNTEKQARDCITATQVEEATTCMQQMELTPPSSAKDTSNDYNPSMVTSSKMQIIAVKRITETSLESIDINQFNDPPTITQIVPHRPPSLPPPEPSYQSNTQDEQVPLVQGNTVVSLIIPTNNELPQSRDFVGHITIINPKDLPAAPSLHTVAPPMSSPTCVENYPPTTTTIVDESPTVAEVSQLADQLYQAQDELSSEGCDNGTKEEEEFAEPTPPLDDDDDRWEVASDAGESSNTKEPSDETTYYEPAKSVSTAAIGTSIGDPNGPNDKISENNNATPICKTESQNCSDQTDFEDAIPVTVVDSQNFTPVDATPSVASVQSRVIDASTVMETSDDSLLPNSDADEPILSTPVIDISSSMISICFDDDDFMKTENRSTDVRTPAHQVKSVTSVGDFVIQELHETDREPNCSSPKQSANVGRSDEVACTEKTTELSTQQSDELEWRSEIVKAPKRTYGRTRKQETVLIDPPDKLKIVDSHAWRWVHVEESDDDDVDLHQNLWDGCDPFRLQFTSGDFNNSTETFAIEPKKQEVIVIDDDEVVVKMEPEEIVESHQETQDDEALQIQKIIETASEILRISEEYKVLNPQDANQPVVESEPELPPAPSPSVSSQKTMLELYSDTDSLVVQTPSRVFDEESNCFYYVDEIQDGASLMGSSMTSSNFPSTYFIYNGEDDQIEENQIETRSSGSIAALENLEPPTTSIPSTFQQTLDKIKTYAFRRKSEAIQSKAKEQAPKLIKKAHSKTHRIEMVLQSTNPSVGKPKRPPRESTLVNPRQRHAVQTQALSLLDALFKQPKLPPLQRTSSTTPCPSTSSSSSSRSASRSSVVPKRPLSSSQQLHSKQPTKKVKLEPPETFDAVDVISLLASKKATAGDDFVDEDESEYLAQLASASASPSQQSTDTANDNSSASQRVPSNTTVHPGP